MHRELLEKICIRPEQALRDAIVCLDASGGEIALVVDARGRLVGTVTDGDIRRALLRGLDLGASTGEAMNPKPHSAASGAAEADIAALMWQAEIGQMPLVATDGTLVDVVFARDFSKPSPAQHAVVIMAGGLGTRLRPLTESIPKPMIHVGGKPILQTIVEHFAEQGFRSVTLCVNYLSTVIEEHFGDGSAFGVDISYIREEQRMGTAGALSLLPRRPTTPVIVINGDILTSANFRQLLSFHHENRALVTMGLNRYQYQLPYGVVQVSNNYIASFVEKPVYDFFVNAGIYVVSPEAIDLIPPKTFFDMPDLLDRVPLNRRVAFPLHEYWLDIGRAEDLDRASQEHERRRQAGGGEAE